MPSHSKNEPVQDVFGFLSDYMRAYDEDDRDVMRAVQERCPPELRRELDSLIKDTLADRAILSEDLSESEVEFYHSPNDAEEFQGYSSNVLDARYRVIRQLGSGGMGTVLLAEDVELRREVAIKILDPERNLFDEKRFARFQAETVLLARLNHPHIVKILARGTFSGQPAFVMEYVRGKSLHDVLQLQRKALASGAPWQSIGECANVEASQEIAPQPAETTADTLPAKMILPEAHANDATRVIIEVVQAVAVSIERGVLHRDLKPLNIMIDGGGAAKVADFGLARDLEETIGTQPSTPGTPRYKAPELRLGSVVVANEATEVYSIGLILYEMITLRRPDECVAPKERMTHGRPPSILQYFSRRSKLLEDLNDIISCALEPQADLRYPRVSALLSDLLLAKSGARPMISRFRPTREFRRLLVRHRDGVVVALLAVVVLIGSLAAVGIREWARLNSYADAVDEATREFLTVSEAREALRNSGGSRDGPDRDGGLLGEEQFVAWRAAIRITTERERQLVLRIERVNREVGHAWFVVPGKVRQALHQAYSVLARYSGEEEQSVATAWAELANADARRSVVRFDTDPTAARVEIFRFDPDAFRAGGLELHPIATTGSTELRTPFTLPLSIGSYVLKVHDPRPEITRVTTQVLCIEYGDLDRERISPTIVLPTDFAEPVAMMLTRAVKIDEPGYFEHDALVFVPPGECYIGSDVGEVGWYGPRRKVSVKGFLASVREVTFSTYLQFLEAPGTKPEDVPVLYENGELIRVDSPKVDLYPVGRDIDDPVEGISYVSAERFCKWLTEQTGYTVRLPTVVEFERMARGADGRPYVRGNDPVLRNDPQIPGDESRTNNPLDVSVFGLFDLERSRAELTSTRTAGPGGVDDLVLLKGTDCLEISQPLARCLASHAGTADLRRSFRVVVEIKP